MDNVHVTKSASAAMAAILVFGAVAAGLIAAPQTAYAAVTIDSSADTFYGPGFVRVLITDTAFDESGDTIFPTIEARDGSTVLGVQSSDEIEAIGGSGQFELFITTSTADLGPANPTKVTESDQAAGTDFANGPFIIRVVEGANSGLTDDGAQTDANGVAAAYAGTNSYGLGVGVGETADIDNFRIVYGGQTLVIDFDDSTAAIAADRTEAGDDTEIVLSITDPDANTDPTLVDAFTFGTPTDLLDSTNAITYGDAEWVETGQNTGIFEQTITVNGGTNEVTATLPTGNSFTVTDHSVYEDVTGTTSGGAFDAVTAESDTDSVSVTLRNRDGAVELLEDPTIANGFQAQITDADRNIDTADEDDIAGGEVVIFIDLDGDGVDDGLGEPDDTFDFTETDESTGIFLPDYNDDKITIELGAAAAVDGAAGTITLTADNVADDVEIVMTYTDPAFQSNSVFNINTEMTNAIGDLSAETTDVSITDDAVITLTDQDLNTDPDTIETYDASGGVFEINGEDVGTLTVEAGDEDDILGVGGVDATFIETGPNTGVFVADDIDIGDIDDAADGADDADSGNLEDGEEITFTYDDLFDDTDDEDSEVVLTLGIPDAGIDVDRSTVPVPQDGDPVTVILSVIDVNANTNPGSIETVDVPFDDIEARDGDNDEFNGDDDPADITDLTGLGGDITLTETGPNTGIFEEDVDLEPDAGIDLDRLVDTRITFNYEDEEVSVTYRAFDGTIVVAPAVVSTGQEFTVTVTDEDLNKDPDEEETVDVACETDEDTEDAGECPVTLTETGKDTGVFEETVEAGTDIDVSDGDDFSEEILFTYVDAVTSAGDEDEDREATVRVATATGQMTVAPEEVGPGTEITLTLIDTDLNDNPNGVDDVDEADEVVEISSSDGDDGFIGFEETGPNTGIFEATIQFEPRDPDVDGALDGAGDEWTYTALPGDVIAFRYEDESTTGGGSTVVSLTFEVTSVDPTMEAASPTVQIGGTIALTVEDSDANRDADAQDSVDIDITSDSDPVGFTLAALETGEDTGIFTVNIPTSSNVVSGAITVSSGDDVFMEYEDEFPADYADRVDTVLDPSKDFVLVVPVGTSVSTDTSATTPEPVVPKDISGNELDEVSAGQQVVLSTTVNNNRNTDLAYAAVIEVRDADGFTVLLQWATGTLPAGDANEIGLSWTPMEAGTYTVRTFVLSDIANPSALSLIEESTLTVS